MSAISGDAPTPGRRAPGPPKRRDRARTPAIPLGRRPGARLRRDRGTTRLENRDHGSVTRRAIVRDRGRRQESAPDLAENHFRCRCEGPDSATITTLGSFTRLSNPGLCKILWSRSRDPTSNAQSKWRVRNRRSKSSRTGLYGRQWSEIPLNPHAVPWYSQITKSGGIRTRAPKTHQKPRQVSYRPAAFPMKTDPTRLISEQARGAVGREAPRGPADGSCFQAARPVFRSERRVEKDGLRTGRDQERRSR